MNDRERGFGGRVRHPPDDLLGGVDDAEAVTAELEPLSRHGGIRWLLAFETMGLARGPTVDGSEELAGDVDRGIYQ